MREQQSRAELSRVLVTTIFAETSKIRVLCFLCLLPKQFSEICDMRLVTRRQYPHLLQNQYQQSQLCLQRRKTGIRWCQGRGYNTNTGREILSSKRCLDSTQLNSTRAMIVIAVSHPQPQPEGTHPHQITMCSLGSPGSGSAHARHP